MACCRRFVCIKQWNLNGNIILVLFRNLLSVVELFKEIINKNKRTKKIEKYLNKKKRQTNKTIATKNKHKA